MNYIPIKYTGEVCRVVVSFNKELTDEARALRIDIQGLCRIALHNAVNSIRIDSDPKVRTDTDTDTEKAFIEAMAQSTNHRLVDAPESIRNAANNAERKFALL